MGPPTSDVLVALGERFPYRCPVCQSGYNHPHTAMQCCPRGDPTEKLRAIREQQPISALSLQIGGDHYRSKAIQPIEFIMANGLGFCEGNVVKYVTRWKDKGGLADLKKARHYLDFLIESQESGMCSTPSGTTASVTGD